MPHHVLHAAGFALLACFGATGARAARLPNIVIVGKWHLGFGRTDDPERWTGPDWNGDLRPGPLEVGFDYFFGHPTVNGTPPTVYVENHRSATTSITGIRRSSAA